MPASLFYTAYNTRALGPYAWDINATKALMDNCTLTFGARLGCASLPRETPVQVFCRAGKKGFALGLSRGRAGGRAAGGEGKKKRMHSGITKRRAFDKDGVYSRA
jgi:hypothetical protein